LCVDDSPEIAGAMQKLLQTEADFVSMGMLDRADDLVGEVVRIGVDIVLLDLTMPGKPPLTALQELSVAVPHCRVIVYSGLTDQGSIDAAVEAGAWGVVSKNTEFSALLDAIRRVMAGEFVSL
jgi:DNA-binding NarL/FixJ family response regulator